MFQNFVSVFHIEDYEVKKCEITKEELDGIGFGRSYLFGNPRYHKRHPPKWLKATLKFDGKTDLDTLIVAFISEISSKFNVVHEDAKMKMFALTIEDSTWFENHGRKEISSLVGLIKGFGKQWDSFYE